MPLIRSELLTIRPTAPDRAVGELLSVGLAQQLPLRAGNQHEIAGSETGEWRLVAAMGGTLTVASYGQYAMLDPGQALALRSPEVCTVQAVSDGVCLALTLHGELPHRLLSDRLEGSAALFPWGAAAVREAVAALAVLEEHPPVDGVTASALAYTLLTKLRAAPLRQAPALSPLVENALAIIQEDFAYLEGLDELAERLGVSKAHLIRSFVKKTGISPGKYLTQVRIQYAKLLLRDEEASITYVAEASGFANANYFAKVFRKETGMSPTEYLESTPPRKGQSRPADQGPLLW